MAREAVAAPLDGRLIVKDPEEWLTIEEAAAELKVARSTFYRWRQRGVGPKSSRLPNREVRIKRRWLVEFAESNVELGGAV